MKITEKEFNATTGETTITEREMTAQELAEFNAEIAAEAARQEAEASKAAEKAALLEKLGISESEAALLLS
jgi:FMN-dependent NADH-azoreductase